MKNNKSYCDQRIMTVEELGIEVDRVVSARALECVNTLHALMQFHALEICANPDDTFAFEFFIRSCRDSNVTDAELLYIGSLFPCSDLDQVMSNTAAPIIRAAQARMQKELISAGWDIVTMTTDVANENGTLRIKFGVGIKQQTKPHDLKTGPYRSA